MSYTAVCVVCILLCSFCDYYNRNLCSSPSKVLVLVLVLTKKSYLHHCSIPMCWQIGEGDISGSNRSLLLSQHASLVSARCPDRLLAVINQPVN